MQAFLEIVKEAQRLKKEIAKYCQMQLEEDAIDKMGK